MKPGARPLSRHGAVVVGLRLATYLHNRAWPLWPAFGLGPFGPQTSEGGKVVEASLNRRPLGPIERLVIESPLACWWGLFIQKFLRVKKCQSQSYAGARKLV